LWIGLDGAVFSNGGCLAVADTKTTLGFVSGIRCRQSFVYLSTSPDVKRWETGAHLLGEPRIVVGLAYKS
jgi:hypothetical protein